jgi:hypothetical protein
MENYIKRRERENPSPKKNKNKTKMREKLLKNYLVLKKEGEQKNPPNERKNHEK